MKKLVALCTLLGGLVAACSSNAPAEETASTVDSLEILDAKIDWVDPDFGVAYGWTRVNYYKGRIVWAHLLVNNEWTDSAIAIADGDDLDTLQVGNPIVHQFAIMLPDEALDGKPKDLSIKVTLDDTSKTGTPNNGNNGGNAQPSGPSCGSYKDCKSCAGVIGCGWCGNTCIRSNTINVYGKPVSNSSIAPSTCPLNKKWSSAPHTC